MTDSSTILNPETAYASARPGSRALWERAGAVFPQGVSGAAKWFSPYPVFVREADGAHVVDVDGNRYVDLLMGAGPMLFGHGHPYIVEAIRAQVSRMTNPMMPVEQGIELAERIRGHMPYLERLRFVNTGSEATRSAIRVARAATGRGLIAKCEGNFHGSDDIFLVSTHTLAIDGPDDRPTAVVDYDGLAPGLGDAVIVLPYNRPEAAVRIIEEHADDLAAVIMEPVSFSSGGGVPATQAFAEAVREATARHGIALVFDEVLCAYRLGLGGAPSYLGVTPDLATIGKAVGGGMPLGAYGGRADLMEAALGADSEHRIFQSGTFTENPVSIAAGMAALDLLEREPILERANAAGEALRAGLARIFDAQGVEAAVTGKDSILQVHLGAGEIRNRRDVVRADVDATRRFLLGMVARGVLWPPIHPAVTSSAHEGADVEAVLAAAEAVLGRAA
ncbi:MAG: aspartate aminotransferase family protein [Actinobacteria bacterium]|nr:aspartate aminotransferase family protein [Actinomycetota bacterium]